jgi:glycosyltransferase involved in cell wall biosynthesis
MGKLFEKSDKEYEGIMKRIWIDLTDIETWSGHHGGTQRVVYGIAKNYYLDKDGDVCFFAYSPVERSFHETSFQPIFDRVENFKAQTLGEVPGEESLKQKVKKKLLHYAPASVRNNKRLKNNIKYIAKKTLAAGKRANSARVKYTAAVKGRLAPTGDPVGSSITFQADDIVLILGKPWDNPDIQRLLIEQKKAQGFKVVQVVYDLIISLYPHLHHPSLFKPYTQNMFDAVTVSDLMIPISKSSERDLKKFCEILNLSVPKTKVIRLGDEIELNDDLLNQKDKPDNRIEDEYLLCVGTIENRKNHMLLYQTYKLAAERGIDLPQLIIAGGRGWLSDDVQYLISHDPSIAKKIILFYSPSDAVLSWLYRNCLFTVYPSLYEGWGLPVAESLAYGKVCVSSGVSSMPEIAGDMLTYFSPNSTDECLASLTAMLKEKTRLKAEERISKDYQMTSWQDTYQQVVKSISGL